MATTRPFLNRFDLPLIVERGVSDCFTRRLERYDGDADLWIRALAIHGVNALVIARSVGLGHYVWTDVHLDGVLRFTTGDVDVEMQGCARESLTAQEAITYHEELAAPITERIDAMEQGSSSQTLMGGAL